MKRFISFVTASLLVFACFGMLMGCGTPRSEILRVFVPGEYMDPEVYDDFAEWYFEKTGKNIEVRETTFESNESMLLKIEKSKADYDVVCPSDYMIERMIDSELLEEIDKEIIDIQQPVESDDGKTEPLIKQTYIDITSKFDPELKYTVPFMYGTFGIMYDYEKTGVHLDSWEYMFFEDNPELGNAFRKKLTQKESVREMYVAACIYASRKELSSLSGGFTDYTTEYKQRLQEIYEDTSISMISEAKRLLQNQKKYILKYEVDDGKFGIAGGTLNASAGLYWSCDVGYVMNDYEDESGDEESGNKNLWYYIPKEGGNVYVDGFVIPKTAGNKDAANLFLSYLCTLDAAVKNSYYIGAISPVSQAYNYLFDEYSNNDEFFEGTAPADPETGWWSWRDMYLDMVFPSNETLKRCGVMKNFKVNNSKVNLMFADIVG